MVRRVYLALRFVLPVAIPVIGCVCLAQAAFARLGETEEDLEKRFGRPFFTQDSLPATEPCDKCLHYRKDDINVIVMFWKGQSVREDYEFGRLIEGESLKKAAAIVQINANGKVLEQPAHPQALNPDLKHGWNTTDGEMAACIYFSSPHTLNVVSRSYLIEQNQRSEAAQSGASGF